MKTAFVLIACAITLLLGSISQLSAADESYQFSPGANLFAYPVDPGSAYLASNLLYELNSQAAGSSIQRYNTEKGLFETCIWKNGTASGADFYLQATEGYIVHTTENFTYQVSGDRVCPQIILAPGLNIATFPCAAPGYNAYQLLEDLGPAVLEVKKQDPSDSIVHTATRESNVMSGSNFTIEHGYSYLVYMDGTSDWYPTPELDAPLNLNGYPGDELAILAWAEPSGLVTGYNVYKTTTPGSNYQKLNALPVQNTEFTDSALTNNSTWYYAVHAIDQFGRESSLFATVAVTPTANTGPTTIFGTIIGEVTWALAGSPYLIDVGGGVAAGGTLTIEPGVVVEFNSGTMDIYGTLISKGTAEHPVTIHADDGSWTGISIEGATSTNSVLEYTHIEDASEPLEITDSSPEISHCELSGTSTRGIDLLRSNAHIHHTSISGSYSTMYGIYMNDSSPLVEYNQISSLGYGIYMYSDSSPQILHNSITEFSNTGLYLSGDSSAQPYPTITGNNIETTRGVYSTYLLRTSTYYNNPAGGIHRTVDARNNYWGTSDPQVIAASIVQWAGGTSDKPYVDVSQFLDSPEGTIIPGNFIPSGPLPADALSWTAAEDPYIVLGHVLVDIGDELTIAPGTEIQFAGGGEVYGSGRNRFSSIQVMGKLTAVGQPDSYIHFLSNTASPEKSDWYGIVFLEISDSESIVSYCRIEHAYMAIRCKGGSPAINNNEIIAGSGSGETWATGIYLEEGNSSEITNNKVSGYSYYDSSGLFSINSAPTVTGNSFDGNRVGIYLKANSSAAIPITPIITANEVINSSTNSFYLYGASDDTKSPDPIINDNIIITPAVTTASFNTFGYGVNSTIVINARNNWWGTYDAAAIAKTIDDKNDTSSNPLVDYRFFLNGAEGQPGTGNQVLGNLPAGASTWSTTGVPYQVIGDLDIPVGTSLTIEAGVELWLSSANTINVEGELVVNGTAANPVKFSSGNMTESPSDWEGIRFIGATSDSSVLTYCRIENAESPLYIQDSSPEISNCEIIATPSTYYTVRLLRSDASIHHSTISTDYDTQHGLYMENSSPQVEYNNINGMRGAIYVSGSSDPQILHNNLIDFSYTGIHLYGYTNNPNPVINYNTLQTENGDYNTYFTRADYYENDPLNGVYLTIDARSNFWGTDNPQVFMGAISQWSGGTSAKPFIDYTGFLDGPEGSPVTGNFIFPGPLPLDRLSWNPANGTYIILGHAIVPNGQELVIAPGTDIEFAGGSEEIFNSTRDIRSSLRVSGKLIALGTTELPIKFASHHQSPARAQWSGIFFYDTADDTSTISYSQIEHAFNSIYCSGASPQITNNSINAGPGSAYSNTFGLLLQNGSSPVVNDNTIDGFNGSYGYGISILDSSPTISNNIISESYHGVYLKNGSPTISDNIFDHNYYGIRILADSNTTVSSAPSITLNSIVDSAGYSVYIYGYSSGDNSANPRPVFTNNSFVTQYSPANSFYTTSYSSSNIVTINAENNWWGTATEPDIANIIRDQSDSTSAPAVDFQPFLSQNSAPLLYRLTVSTSWLSPNSDGSQDSVTISWLGSPDVSDWTATIRDGAGVIVRSQFVGSLLEWTWDGKNDSAVLVPDGEYSLTISGSDSSGTVEQETVVHIDTQPIATVLIDSPTDAQVLQNIFDVVVTVLDQDISSYTLEIGKGSSPTSWTLLQTSSKEIENGSMYAIESNTIDTDIIPSLTVIGDLTDGLYTLRLTATDLAGNTSVVNRTISFENVFITDVSVTELAVDITNHQPAAVEFTIDKTADVELRIYTEAEGNIDQLVRVVSQSFPPGTHSLTWDGRNNSSQYVPEAGYIFVLVATTGTGLTDQFITAPVLNVPESWTPVSSYNTSTNDWFTADCTMGNVPGRYEVRVTPSGETQFTVFTRYYAAHESFLFTWDGRRPDGTLVDVNTSFFVYDTWGNANMFIVHSSSEPQVTGQAANVNVKSDPPLINFCYGEQTSLLYNLDRQAEITITLFPLEEDASSPDAIVLVDQEIQAAGDHTVTWSGTDATDARHVMFSREGLYTFIIEATSAGVTSTSRGVVSLYK